MSILSYFVYIFIDYFDFVSHNWLISVNEQIISVELLLNWLWRVQ